MSIADIIILALIAVAFVAVCLRVREKGSCGDCAGGCSGTCNPAHKKTCAAMKGVDEVAARLARGVK